MSASEIAFKVLKLISERDLSGGFGSQGFASYCSLLHKSSAAVYVIMPLLCHNLMRMNT